MTRSRPSPPRVYAIADAAALGDIPVSQGAAHMAEAGIRWIQVRAKQLSDRRLFDEAERCCRLLGDTVVDLWIDDRPDLAALLPFAGVQLGQTDLPPRAARPVIDGGRWIGRSTHSEEQIREADLDPEVDVVCVGPVYPTTGKRHPDPVVGLDLVRRARELTAKPLVAIGGIDASRLPEVLAAGADSAAVLGAACRGDVAESCRRLLAAADGTA